MMHFNPNEIRKAGTFNKDMKAPVGKSGTTSQGLKCAPITEYKMSSTKSSAMSGKKANFTSDADMQAMKSYSK